MSATITYKLVHSDIEFKVQRTDSLIIITNNRSETMSAVIQEVMIQDISIKEVFHLDETTQGVSAAVSEREYKNKSDSENLQRQLKFLRILVNPFQCNDRMCNMIMPCLENIFSFNQQLDFVLISGLDNSDSLVRILKFTKESENIIKVKRSDFYQSPYLWQYFADYSERSQVVYPQRNPFNYESVAKGIQYKRYVPSINKTISFRAVNLKKDLDIFYDWHNQPRIYDLWELNKPKEELRAYLTKGLQDPHQIPLIYEVDGEPVGYFEIYWVAEDRLAPYYEYQLYDRGFHFLIGNKKYLGSINTGVAVISVMHMIYLDDERTDRIVAEPRADNRKVIRYSELIPGWKFVKEFDFPHKRAVLLMADRKPFFEGGNL